MSVLSQVVGLPGMRSAKTSSHRMITRGGWIPDILPQGRVIAGGCSADTSNSPTYELQAGLLMGKIGSVVNSLGTVGFYAPSVVGVTTVALTNGGTTVTTTAPVVTEAVRRFGATGTFTITGPPTANGVARSLTATYSATSATTFTVTALGVNEVQQINFNIASTGGSVTLQVPKANGQMITTTAASWNATDATYLANIQTVLDVATGVANGIVASAISATDTDLGFILTYSGTGYAGLPQPLAAVVGTLPSSSTTWTIARNTAGVDGRMVAGSLIQPTDGSQTPLTFLPSGTPIRVQDYYGSYVDVPFAEIPIDGIIDPTQFLPVWPTDTGLKNYLKTSLNSAYGCKFMFDDAF